VKQTHLSAARGRRWPPSCPPLSLFFHEKMTLAPGTAILCYKVHDVIFLSSLNFHFWDKITGKFKEGLQKNGHFPAKIFTKVSFTKKGVWCISERKFEELHKITGEFKEGLQKMAIYLPKYSLK
jgi:hypothetical protein